MDTGTVAERDYKQAQDLSTLCPIRLAGCLVVERSRYFSGKEVCIAELPLIYEADDPLHYTSLTITTHRNVFFKDCIMKVG